MYRQFLVRLQSIALLISFLALTACGGGSSGSEPEQLIEGAGIKGPLAFATVELYQFDTGFEQLYDPNNPIASATTSAYAKFSGLRVPRGMSPPFILVINGENAIDLNTGVAPVIKKLVTVITQKALKYGRSVYATPYTTLAYNMLVISESEAPDVLIETALSEFSGMITHAIGFGMPAEVDLFSTSPLITADTTTIEEQQIVVEYRAAIEALSTLLNDIYLPNQAVSTDDLLSFLASDLYSNSVIDDSYDGQTKEGILDLGILTQDPMNLKIANTDYYVRDAIALMDEERALVGVNSRTPMLTDSLTVSLQPAALNAVVATDAPPAGGSTMVASPSGSTAPDSMDLASTLLASGLVASGPIVINGESDVVISGKHITNPNGDCIVVSYGASNITIKDSIIGPCGGKGIEIHSDSHHVTITGNYIYDIERDAVMSYESYDITVDSNMMERVQRGYSMWTTSMGNLRFTNNFVKNILGKDDGNFQPGGESRFGNMVMAAFVRGPGIRINNNININVRGESQTEDLVNTYKSRGRPDDPIQVNNNIFYGSGPDHISGGGILLADVDGAYQEARNNIIVNPGSYGLAMVEGHHLVFSNNKVYSDDQQPFTNVGVMIGWGTGSEAIEFSNNEITYSQGTHWVDDPYLYPYWKEKGWNKSGLKIIGWDTNKFDKDGNQPANLDETILPEYILNYN